MNNKQIISKLKLAVSLLEVDGANPFKIRGYQNTVLFLDKLDFQLSNCEDISKIDGISKGMIEKVEQIISTGTFDSLNELLEKTNPIVLELLKISGLGPKKIKLIVSEFNISSLEDLLALCDEGKVAAIKGFGAKTEEKIKSSIEFILKNKGAVLYAEAEGIAELIENQLSETITDNLFSKTGELRRKTNTITEISFLIGVKYKDISQIRNKISALDFLEEIITISNPFLWFGTYKEQEVNVSFKFCEKHEFYNKLLIESGTDKHIYHSLDNGKNLSEICKEANLDTEEAIYEKAGLSYIIPELREGLFEFTQNKEKLENIIQLNDLKGCLHNHSTYSDGANTIEEMANYCKEQGYEYFGISDHSKTAFYANGLYPEQVIKQHKEIDELNKKLAPFKIFKGIESDILPDGSLDYDEEVLKTFDFIVASIHSGLDMDKSKATQRLIKAIENPYTTMLGHPTGRLLLRRKGYEIDHKKIIDACAKNKVIIEINAHPKRLDIDWQWIPYAMEKGVMISINPDAHELKGIHDMYFGVCSARKGGLTREFTFNVKSREEVENYFLKKSK